MDFYGIGSAMQAMVRVYFQTSRSSGRTSSLIDSLHDGDRVVFVDSKEADRVYRLCKERELEVKCITVPPNNPMRLLERGPSMGRTIFSHRWVEQYYEMRLVDCARDIDDLEHRSSGCHERSESRFSEKETSKWSGL